MYKSPLSCKEAKFCMHKKYSNKFKMYADSHQYENHCSSVAIVMCSHTGP